MPIVDNIEALRDAIADNKTDIVLAESGDFVDESAKFDESQVVSLTGKDGITIRSEDPNDPETLVGLKIKNSPNIIVENVKLTGWDKSDPNAGEKPAAAQVENSNNVVFSGVTFETKDDFESILFGLRVTGSDNVTVENSQFSNLREGFKGINSSNLTVRGNEFVDIIVDAIDLSNPNGVTIENNIIRDFDPDVTKLNGEHADAIQFRVENDFEAKDISIKNNVALMGNGSGFQGIFIQTKNNGSLNEVDIENNLIHTTAKKGIDIGKATNLDIKDNTVVFRDSELTEFGVPLTAITVGNAENAVVENNIAGLFEINGESFGGRVSSKEPPNGNILANYEVFKAGFSYEDVFVNGDMLTDPEFYSTISPEDFAVLDGIDAGANLGQLPETMAGAPPIDGMSGGNGNPDSSPEPTTSESEILISFGNANANNDVFGTAEADVMQADSDSSGLRGLGRDGNDTLLGANNVDLSGENGDDLLVLNGGDSLISGGAGRDTFVITSETQSGSNILDFEKGVDTIEFRDIQGVGSFSDLDITPQNRNSTANSIISFGDEQIKIKDMMVEDFSAGDFEFS